MNKKTEGFAVVFFCFFCFQAFGQSRSSQYLFQENFRAVDTSNNVTNIGFSDGKRIIYDGFLPLLDNGLSDSALAVLNREELRLLRNTIYARHGYIFQSNDLRNHFQRFNWYNPRRSNVDALLTDVDKWNVGRIQLFENAVPNHRLNKRDLVGFWGTPTRGDAEGDEIAINNDDTIFVNIYYPTFKGNYRIENGFLVVFVTEQYVGSPDYILDRRWRWPNGVTFNNGTVFYNEPIRLIFPVGNLEDAFGLNGRRIGASLYAFSRDSFYFWR
jgi:hypothetical protein